MSKETLEEMRDRLADKATEIFNPETDQGCAAAQVGTEFYRKGWNACAAIAKQREQRLVEGIDDLLETASILVDDLSMCMDSPDIGQFTNTIEELRQQIIEHRKAMEEEG